MRLFQVKLKLDCGLNPQSNNPTNGFWFAPVATSSQDYGCEFSSSVCGRDASHERMWGGPCPTPMASATATERLFGISPEIVTVVAERGPI